MALLKLRSKKSYGKKIFNGILLRETDTETLLTVIERRRMQWTGQFTRMTDESLPRTALKWPRQDKRIMGRSRQTRRHTVEKMMINKGLTSMTAR